MGKIKLSEVKKYEKIYKNTILPKDPDLFEKEIFLAKLRNGSKIENNLKENDIIFSTEEGEKIKKLSLRSFLPYLCRINIVKDRGRYDPNNKEIYGPVIENEKDLMIGMHEIGHAWDWVNNEEFYFENDPYDTEIIVRQERNAWAWALKKMGGLRKQGFIDRNMANTEIVDTAKAALYHGVELWPKEDTIRRKFLNKEL